MIRITLVDDLAMILEGIKVLINQVENFEVVDEYNNGADFIENFDASKTDIVLMDIEMPVMNGIEATKKVLQIYPDLKIITLSMYSDQKYYYEMIHAGAKGFVLKQSTSEDLEEAINAVYEGNLYFSQNLLTNVIIKLNSSQKEQEIVFKSQLSDREVDLVSCICQGMSNKEVASSLGLSVKTIESNKAQLMKKTATKNNAGLIIWAVKNKVIEI